MAPHCGKFCLLTCLSSLNQSRTHELKMSSAIAEPVTAHEQEDEEEDQYQDYLRAAPDDLASRAKCLAP